jgi:hypothetical protein
VIDLALAFMVGWRSASSRGGNLVTALEAIIGERAAAIVRDDEHDPAAGAEVAALTLALAALRALTPADIKAKTRALAGPTPITADLVEALSSEERELAASILRDVLALV